METAMDSNTRRSARLFLTKVAETYPLAGAWLFGSRARGDQRPGSDADIAVLLRGAHGERTTAARLMAGIAFDVMLDTGILIDPLPLWEDEWRHPEQFSNPALIEGIRRDGVPV